MFRFVLILALTAMVFASSGAKKLLAAQMEGPAEQVVVSIQADDVVAIDSDSAAHEHETGDKCHQTVAVLTSTPLVKDRWAKSQPMSVDIDRLTGVALKLLKRPPRDVS